MTPTHKVIDLIHVGQPFFNVNVRYHCPIYGIFKVPKHCIHVLRDEYGYMIVETIIIIVKNCSVSTGMNLLILEIAKMIYASHSSNVILQAAGESIPNKIITVGKTDPPWMNGAIRRDIRKRNRFQRQAKKSNLPVHWANFRKSRNKTINIIRRQKKTLF